MIFTIVFKDGSIKRLLQVGRIDKTPHNIRFFANEKIYSFPRKDIASVVYYP